MVYLHIGAMKTGTTYLQNLLFGNSAGLAQAGFLVPGSERNHHALAGRDILEMRTSNPRIRSDTDGAWAPMAAQMVAHDGVASIFSMEFLSFADVDRARRVVDSLRGAEVHVILAIRDATSAIPAQWQTNCRNGGVTAWPAFAKQVRRTANSEEPRRSARVFLRAQDVSRMLGVWTQVVPPDHVHVLVVPSVRTEPELLWKRFAAVVGVNPAVCSAEGQPSNPSLGYASADLMRRVNLHIGRAAVSEHAVELKQLAKILTEHASAEARVPVDAKTRRFAARWNLQNRRAIRASGVRVVGRLAEIPVSVDRSESSTVPTALTDPDIHESLSAAATAIEGLARLILEEAQHPADLLGEAPTRIPAVGEEAERLDAAVAEISAMLGQLVRVRASGAGDLSHPRALP